MVKLDEQALAGVNEFRAYCTECGESIVSPYLMDFVNFEDSHQNCSQSQAAD